MARQTRRSTRHRDSRYDTRDDVVKDETPNKSLLKMWQVTSFLSIIIPIVIFSLCHLFSREEWNGNDNDDAGRRGVIIFTYFISLLLFLGIVANGNSFLSISHHKKRKYWHVIWHGVRDAERSAQDLGLLTGALLMFACFSFLLFLVSVSLLMNFERMENFKESFNQMALIIPFTFLLWSIFCGSFGYSFFLTNPGDFTTDSVDIGNESNVKEGDEAAQAPATSIFSGMKTHDLKSTNDSKKQPLV